jgi:hypothetical protein
MTHKELVWMWIAQQGHNGNRRVVFKSSELATVLGIDSRKVRQVLYDLAEPDEDDHYWIESGVRGRTPGMMYWVEDWSPFDEHPLGMWHEYDIAYGLGQQFHGGNDGAWARAKALLDLRRKESPLVIHAASGEAALSLCGTRREQGHEAHLTKVDSEVNCPACLDVLQRIKETA